MLAKPVIANRVRIRRCLLIALALGSALLGQRAVAGPAVPVPFAAPAPPAPLRRLTSDGQSTPAAWTGDGSMLLVQRPGRMLPGQQLSELWAVPLQGDEWLISDNASYPAPEGDQVAYLQYQGDAGWEAVRSYTSGKATTVLGPADWKMPPTWVAGRVVYLDPADQLRGGLEEAGALPSASRACLALGGQRLASTENGGLRIVENAQSKSIAVGRWVGGLAWSPDGARLAYVLVNEEAAVQLWVWDAATGAHLLLFEERQSTLGAPAWSPDGERLAFAVYPSGSATGGDIWLVHADGTQAEPVARTPGSEDAPRWSPDGTSLAFRLDGDVWIAELGSPDLQAALLDAAQAPAPLAAALRSPGEGSADASAAAVPDTILVKHDDSGNLCRDRPEGAIDTYGFEPYLQRVIPHEVPASWPAESLKAQAVAARTYAWRKLLDRRAETPYPGFDVWDSTRDQYMCDWTDTRTNAAVDATRGHYMSYENKVIYAFYSAEAGSPTNYKQQFPDVPYLRSVDDPGGIGEARHGHSWGLSQWGAYRWAAWHGWDYIQILTHYYSDAVVTPSIPGCMPVAGLSQPWADHYLLTDYALLRANAADDAPISGVTFEARIDDTWQTACTDSVGADGWGCVWSVGVLSDTVSLSLSFRATATSADGGSTTSAISSVGLHRTPPTGTLSISASTVTTLNLTLALSAADPAPPQGDTRVSLGDDSWVWEDLALYHIGGDCVAEASTEDGSAWHVSSGESGVLYGPYTERLAAGELYRALFRIRALTETLSLPSEVAKLDVTTDQGSTLLGVRYLRGTDLPTAAYAEYAVDFVGSQSPLEFRVDARGIADLWVDRVRIVTYPGQVLPEVAWTLPPREGRTVVTAKYVDPAGNLSADVSLPVWVKDVTAPGEWHAFRCTGTSCAVEVRDHIAGLDVTSASYRVSADRGLSWGDWLPATCSGSSGSHDWETVTAGPLALLGPGDVQLQFRIRDVAHVPNESVSSALTLWHTYLPVVHREAR
jgi:hypothetical protein